jgi:hypothetical protein
MSSQLPHVRLEDQKVLKLIERLRQQKLKITTPVMPPIIRDTQGVPGVIVSRSQRLEKPLEKRPRQLGEAGALTEHASVFRSLTFTECQMAY